MRSSLPFPVAFLLLVSCGKYEEGTDFTLSSRKSRLTRSWDVESIYRNGEPLLFFEPIDITETYHEDGSFRTEGSGSHYSGTWLFKHNDMRIERVAGANSDIIEIDRL